MHRFWEQIYATITLLSQAVRLTVLQPTKKCKLFQIADLDKIAASRLVKHWRVIYGCTFIDWTSQHSTFHLLRVRIKISVYSLLKSYDWSPDSEPWIWYFPHEFRELRLNQTETSMFRFNSVKHGEPRLKGQPTSMADLCRTAWRYQK